MIHYKLRIDSHSDDNLLITKGMSKYSYCYEGTDLGNPHMHFHIISDLKRASLIARVKALPHYVKGNGFYSLRELRPEDDGYLRYDAYIMKETKPVYVGYSSDEITAIEEFDAKIKQEIKEKKQSRKTILQQIDDKYFSEVDDGILDGTYVMKEFVVDKVLEFFQESGSLVREFQMISICQTLCLKYVRSYSFTLRNKILEKI